MSEQQSESDRSDQADTKQAGTDNREPTPERQAELQAAYEANVGTVKAPYEGVEIRTLGELNWVMQERKWSGAASLSEGYERANLSAVNLSGASLYNADLSGAYLGADLSGARLGGTNLSGATSPVPKWMPRPPFGIPVSTPTRSWPTWCGTGCPSPASIGRT